MIPLNIILHCSATKDSDSGSWRAIKEFHTEVRGWRDIGYHYGIEEFEGEIVILRGRHPRSNGAHCRAAGRNSDSLGVCVVGEFDTEPPSEDVYEATVALLASLCFTFHIPPADVYGHCEWEPTKTCPGERWNLDRLRSDIHHMIRHAESLGHYLEV